MKQIISIDFYLENLEHIPLIDVRSPGEFAKGHVPNATNLELFSDEERVVGLLINKSQRRAIEIGFEYVKPMILSLNLLQLHLTKLLYIVGVE
jgi:tRNA 2-selenouridine synthase